MRVKFTSRIFAIVALPIFLAGCASTNSAKNTDIDTNKVASGRDIVKAFDGGILPSEQFRKLSRSNRTRALFAEFRALESSGIGQSVAWQAPNGKSSGTVVAAAPYQVGSQNCRQYTHKAVISGSNVEASGAACRSADGRWIPLR